MPSNRIFLVLAASCAVMAIVSRAWLARHPSRESSSP